MKQAILTKIILKTISRDCTNTFFTKKWVQKPNKTAAYTYWKQPKAQVDKFILFYTMFPKNVTTLSHYNSWHTWINFNNFWHKCYWESRQSKSTLFSHLT